MTELASEAMNIQEEALYVFFREHDTDNIGFEGVLLPYKNKKNDEKKTIPISYNFSSINEHFYTMHK